MTEQTAPVIFEAKGGVGIVSLNQPEKRNSFTDEMLYDLLEKLEQAASDPEIRVIVLTGNGKSFSVGGDLDEFAAGEFKTVDIPHETSVSKLRNFMRVSQYLRTSEKVTIAAINGACAGAGLSVAAACDLRFASTKSVFRTAFIDAGLSGDFGGTWSLVRLLGEARAKELYLLNQKLTPEDALRIGLVSWVESHETFMPRVLAEAEALAAKPPIAMKLIKKNLTEEHANFLEALEVEADRHVFCGYTDDAVEAAAAFLEKREPNYTGK
ncbi:enoyl-CoA hydratase/isomerase family protein [Mycolicibacterium litorale]|uniref:enoyl-CoA hydratase/isomerase family protein n=1 Tax=Mycolicibacterium litorale TaxID=758802 RepID=UPI003CF38BF8